MLFLASRSSGTAFSAIHAGTDPEQVILRCNSEGTFSQGQREVPMEYFLSLKEKSRDAVFSLTRARHEKEKFFPLPFQVHLVQGRGGWWLQPAARHHSAESTPPTRAASALRGHGQQWAVQMYSSHQSSSWLLC